MNSANSGKGTAGDVESILSGLGEILISKNLEKMINAFREALKPVLEQIVKVRSLVETVKGVSVDLKPVLEQIVKVEDAVVKMGKDLADFKLSIMKEIIMLRDQLRTLNEGLISLEGRLTSLAKAEEGGIKEAEKELVLEGGEGAAVQEEAVEIKANALAGERSSATREGGVVEKEVRGPVFVPEDIEKTKEIAKLETRLVKLKGEISSLQTLIEVGLGGGEEKEALNAKLREKKEIEEKISKLRGGG
ncbi:MAG: hypothetical protein KIH01_03990 [Candidatus Freyarchaeota archaeon]|nr:hypothetical protein [Candidatus Jordarchaeia archaeon]